MRRISLALALVSAVAAGCSMGSKPSANTTGNGTAKGEQGVYYFVNLFATPVGGTIASNIAGTPAAINCGASAVTVFNNGPVATPDWQYSYTYIGNACGTKGQTRFNWTDTVILTATPAAGKAFLGWAGDCTGSAPTCTLTAGADKTVVAMFGVAGAGHANFLDPAQHGPAYSSYWAAVTAVPPTTPPLDCAKCHGADLLGQGIAPSCASCHPAAAAPADLNVGHAIATGHNTVGQCARCHTGGGFRDFIGADGTASSVLTLAYGSGGGACTAPNTPVGCTIDSTVAFANGIACDACHNSTTILGGGTLNQKKFASGNTVTMDGKTAICAQCHDGGRPGYEISQLGVATGVTTDDTLLASTQKTQRAHYLPAASTLFGADAATYYQYPGRIYTARNQHGGIASCVDCHNPHNGALPADAQIASKCGACHEKETGGPVTTFMELEETRQFGFEGDIDGDGVPESLKLEIDGLGAKLLQTMQAYATVATGNNICVYSNRAYTFTSGTCGTAPNNVEFSTFTPRLLRAVFNYLMYQNDTGGWAHNPRYEIEILFDTIRDLNLGIVAKGGTAVAFTGKRAFNGHFGAANDPTPYAAMMDLDASGNYGFSAACSQCHGGAVGLANYLSTAPAAVTTLLPGAKVPAFQCATCHAFNGADMTGIRSDIANVYFPPQKGVTPNVNQKVITVASAAMPPGNAVCASCHSARENGATIDMKVGVLTNTSWSLSFSNPHYLGAAAMIMGSTTAPMAQYGTTSYSGKAVFWKAGTNGAAPGPHGSPHGAECNGCHRAKESKHTFEVDFAYCGTCHVTTPYGDFRLAPVEEEFRLRSAELYTAIRTAAAYNAASLQTVFSNPNASGICYDGNAYPYWFLEVSGLCSTTQFNKFNPSLLRAAYNYQWTVKEPGAWAHNEPYVTQVMFDAITDLGGTPSFARPAVTP